ncbi:hypothetical protein L227DRAFT_213325 [Lentinus tigrinus ALCF2SS1-6]|uniref:Uncharacterized protein n=1 Tax=Lentinus tigrinus ALCF2SS1-6 TaxID=1328759 RepID=A0A5C2SQ71_9APHY|nr:hypothetical protein L227DRAFT_213325 [Lentinus tigrinus ALCF2SS1-6]
MEWKIDWDLQTLEARGHMLGRWAIGRPMGHIPNPPLCLVASPTSSKPRGWPRAGWDVLRREVRASLSLLGGSSRSMGPGREEGPAKATSIRFSNRVRDDERMPNCCCAGRSASLKGAWSGRRGRPRRAPRREGAFENMMRTRIQRVGRPVPSRYGPGSA